ncbi:hypothetical protein [Peribacillus butanolivorans]|uniref:hypothetical protein n=1 Tax=Peribacillus butanolivorans TaxID=421767 RepID=UPI0036556055
MDNTKRKAFKNAVKQGIYSFDLNEKVYEISETEEIPKDVLDMLWRDQKLTAIDNPYGSCRARLNGNCPYAEEPPCLTCNGGSPCKDLAIMHFQCTFYTDFIVVYFDKNGDMMKKNYFFNTTTF